MTIAICPGSFDPVTKGHLDVIKRAAVLFDKVIVVVMVNRSKNPIFTAKERKDFLTRTVSGIQNVETDIYDGLLADYAMQKQATAIVKGLRVMSDFEYEFQMALTNMSLAPGIETILLPTSVECMFLSSSMVREVARHGRDITPFVPEGLAEDISARLYQRSDKDEN
jgi:pantetheine-phosphate adenylyltransferase